MKKPDAPYTIVTIRSNSMHPVLPKGTLAVLDASGIDSLGIGDIVGFTSSVGLPLVHRVIALSKNTVHTMADASRRTDTPVDKKNVFGSVTAVKVGGRWIHIQQSYLCREIARHISQLSARIALKPAFLPLRIIRKMLVYSIRLLWSLGVS